MGAVSAAVGKKSHRGEVRPGSQPAGRGAVSRRRCEKAVIEEVCGAGCCGPVFVVGREVLLLKRFSCPRGVPAQKRRSGSAAGADASSVPAPSPSGTGAATRARYRSGSAGASARACGGSGSRRGPRGAARPVSRSRPGAGARGARPGVGVPGASLMMRKRTMPSVEAERAVQGARAAPAVALNWNRWYSASACCADLVGQRPGAPQSCRRRGCPRRVDRRLGVGQDLRALRVAARRVEQQHEVVDECHP